MERGNSGIFVCVDCPRGTYKAVVGNDEDLCIPCPAGSTSTTTGNSMLSMCSEYSAAIACVLQWACSIYTSGSPSEAKCLTLPQGRSGRHCAGGGTRKWNTPKVTSSAEITDGEPR